jgi:lipopolysaccharide biosynthesis regulator YciM
MKYFLFLLIPLLLYASFYLGRKAQRRSSRRKLVLSKHYFVGLNYLLNEQPDKAIDVFVRMLSVDNDTFETHVAIGSLFRRRGEVERAIRIHQNLLSQPDLSRSIRIQALMELGRDYLSAGLYDRAERLFLEAIDLGGKAASSSFKHLISIYQHEKEWLKAIEYAHLFQTHLKESQGVAIAHYYCELIESQLLKLTDRKFQIYLEEALLADPKCVRARLIEAKWHEAHGDFKSAITAYNYIRSQDKDYISETIKPITACYIRLQNEAGLRDYLYQCLNDSPQFAVILMITDKLQEWHGNKVAADFIADQLATHPSLLGLARLIEFYANDIEDEHGLYFKKLAELMGHFLKNEMTYRCVKCGFNSEVLIWLCPDCQHWNTIKPLY